MVDRIDGIRKWRGKERRLARSNFPREQWRGHSFPRVGAVDDRINFIRLYYYYYIIFIIYIYYTYYYIWNLDLIGESTTFFRRYFFFLLKIGEFLGNFRTYGKIISKIREN